MSTALDDDVDAYLQHGRTQGWTAATLRSYTRRLTTMVRFCRQRGCRRAADVTAEDLGALMEAEHAAGTAKSSRVGLASLVSSFFAWLHERGRLVRDPARSLPVPDDGEPDLPEPPLTEAEVQALLAGLPRQSITDVRSACLLELLYGCGLRRSEVVHLDLEDVDLTQYTVWVRDGKGGQHRCVPLMGTAATAVRDWLALRRTMLRGPDQGALFLSRGGRRIAITTLEKVFLRLNASRGPEARRIHPHLLRHSIAVHLLRGGADVRHIQAFLGHASLDTTKVYLRLVPGRLKEEYDKAMPEIAVGLPAAP
jgi:site-specific recombinase XerD